MFHCGCRGVYCEVAEGALWKSPAKSWVCCSDIWGGLALIFFACFCKGPVLCTVFSVGWGGGISTLLELAHMVAATQLRSVFTCTWMLFNLHAWRWRHRQAISSKLRRTWSNGQTLPDSCKRCSKTREKGKRQTNASFVWPTLWNGKSAIFLAWLILEVLFRYNETLKTHSSSRPSKRPSKQKKCEENYVFNHPQQ